MKALTRLATIATASLVPQGLTMTALRPDAVPAELREYVQAGRAPCPYLQLPPSCLDDSKTLYHPVVSRSQALADLCLLRYLFDNAYSGRAYWARHGVDFQGMYDALGRQAAASDSVRTSDLEEILCKYLAPIEDGHLAVVGKGEHRFFTHQDAYFSDIVVEKQGDRYVTVASTCDRIATGSVFSGPTQQLFPTLSRSDHSDYLVGVLSRTFVQALTTSFGGKLVTVPLHLIRMPEWDNTNTGPYREYKVEGIPVIMASSFLVGYDKDLVQFENSAREVRKAKELILDLRDNEGGSDEYSLKFFTNLGGSTGWQSTWAALYSPAIDQSWASMGEARSPVFVRNLIRSARERLLGDRRSPQRQWAIHFPSSVRQRTGNWPGKLVVLMNRHTESAAETAIAYSRSVIHDSLVGENSGGIETFGEVRWYALPYTGLRLSLPSKIFKIPGFSEGIGFKPDYWLDSAHPVREIVRWLSCPLSYRYVPPTAADLSRIDIRRVVDNAPQGMASTVYSADPKGGRYSRVAEDPTGGIGQRPCLRLSADAKTSRFYFVGVDIPSDVAAIRAEWIARGKNIEKDGHVFPMCFVGFSYRDADGRRRLAITRYRGTFGWQQSSASLDISRLGASNVRFGFVLGESGELWVDGLKLICRSTGHSAAGPAPS